ncbi:MAG: glycosyl transferase, group 1 [Geminicoccaceae bacterium]|jgi:glycosyltransferase involved in cell wall biosynthesis|nr:glycosyl transferase, group 1 [Geminicoccaceae bacterium]MCE3246897.1 glycosyl transferase, group 1 [Geminicoccaceae bacterium]
MQRVAWDLATGLAERGHQVKVVTTATADGRHTAIPAELSDRLAVEHLHHTRPARYSRSWWRESRAAYLRGREEGLRPDVVLSVSAGAWSVLPLLGTVPAVLQAHGTSIAEIRSKVRTGRLAAMLGAFQNLCWVPWDLGMYRRCEKVVAVGPMAYAALRHPLIRGALPQDKVVMIPNGVDTATYRPGAAAKPELARQLGLPRGAKVLVWASRLHRQKGTHLALSAFAEIAARDLSFVIIGHGPERGNLERQAQALGVADRVRFLGQIDSAEMPRWLSVGDAFVFTSIREEGFPLNILEAMSMNLPVVASDSLVEALERVDSIYAVNPSDSAAVSRAMQQAVATAGSGRALVERRYSRQVMVQGYEDLFHRLVAA